MNNNLRILNFIKKQELGVVSTLGPDNEPQSAVVAITETANLELIFGTFASSRKYRNLKTNHSISVVIGWDDWITVQYEGLAQELERDQLETAKRLHVAKHPKSAEYVNHPEERFFRVTPKWIRFTDFNQHPEEIFEVTF